MSLSPTHPLLGRTNLRRGENHIPCHIPAAVFIGGDTFPATCVNISQGGFAIELDPELPDMVKYTLVLAVNDADYLVFDAAPQSNALKSWGDTQRRQLGFAVDRSIPGFEMLLERVQQQALAGATAQQPSDFRQPYQRPNPEPLEDAFSLTTINVGKTVKQQIGRFGILAKLGGGLIGTSFHVRDKDEQEYTLKVIHRKHLADEQQHQAWLTYLAQLRDIQHDLFVPILEIGLLENKHLYLLSPYYAKGSLKEACEPVFQQGETPHPTHVRHWLATTCETLRFLHGQNLVHANLKPENLLIDNHDRLCLADPLPPLELLAAETRQELGKAPFIAPATGTLSQRGLGLDVYGFGALAEYLLTGALRGLRNPLVPLTTLPGGKRTGAFLAACQRAVQAKNIPRDQLGQAFRNAFPLEENEPTGDEHTFLFGDPLTVYQRTRDLIEREHQDDAAAKRRLERLRVALGLTRHQVQTTATAATTDPSDADFGGQPQNGGAPNDVSSGDTPPLTMDRTFRAPNGAFWLVDALGFPFKSLMHLLFHGLAMTAVLYSTGFIFKMYLPMFGSFFLGPAKWMVSILYGGVIPVLMGMFVLRSKAIVQGAVAGETDWPDADNPTSYWEIAYGPTLQLTAVLILCFGPFLLTMGAFFSQVFSGVEPTTAAETYGPMLLATMAFGWFLVPWAALSVFSYDSISALNPLAWLNVYLRAALDYLILALIFAFLFTAASFLFLTTIGVNFSPFGFVAATFGLVYLWFTCMRAIGIFQYRNKDLFFHHGP